MERNDYFDNCKAILIILVVTGHIVEVFTYNSSPIFVATYRFLYTFHMPVFVLLAGYFCKYIKNIPKKELKYFLLFILFTLLYFPFSRTDLMTDLLTPYWILWFLISLTCWYILIQIFKGVDHALIISVIIAIIAGYINQIGLEFSLSRTLAFFPFFVLGYSLHKDQFPHINKKIAGIVLIAFFAFLIFSRTSINEEWLFGCYSYASVGHPEWYAGVYRLGAYALAVITGTCFLSIVPTTRKFYTRWGSHTLYIYLIHGLVIKLIAVAVYTRF